MLLASRTAQPVVIRDDWIVVLWAFALIFLLVWTWLSVYFARYSDYNFFVILVLTLGGVFSLGFTAVALALPRIRVEISRDGVLVRERAVFWSRTRQFAAKDLSVSDVVETEDSESGVHYTCS